MSLGHLFNLQWADFSLVLWVFICIQEACSGGRGGTRGGDNDPVLSLLKDISSCLAALEEKASTSQPECPAPVPSTSQPTILCWCLREPF